MNDGSPAAEADESEAEAGGHRESIVSLPPPRTTPSSPLPIQPAATNCQNNSNLPPLATRIPNTAFGIPMGLGGNALIWTNLLATKLIPDQTGRILQWSFWVVTLVSAVVVSTCFFVKCRSKLGRDIIREEWRHPARVHFFHGPHLIIIMLTLAAPFPVSRVALQVLWTITAISQSAIALSIYERWMFDPKSELSCGKPQFFLSTVGWFFLLVLGVVAEIDTTWGIDFPAFCLGAGSMFYLIVVVSNFSTLHKSPEGKAQPALFLFLAPPSVGMVGVALYTGEFGLMARAVFGYCIIMLLLLARIGVTIMQDPAVLGVYWAYIFPLAALASASARYAADEGTLGARILCYVLVTIAVLAVAVVLTRMTLHTVVVMKGKAVWGDPIMNGMRDQLSVAVNVNTTFGAGYNKKGELLPSELNRRQR
eukprot:CAMPEP_0181027484 /NCGR_PEP_ID=MMETSP1070-20121207/4188_1 /TAXON_ID=265543 /ORGANISM="Minutocellus polymorphus, Strain NH13" /LENGTH=422 /DNA_ID=CAMNT_0023104727 /DNA_START=40 /DNA_END=1308 /DNA_ORIENTATION=+